MTRCITALAFLCLSAGLVRAQTAIVAVDVTPMPRVLKHSTFDKPVVVKSAKDAATYFDKDALEALGRQVDFDKQIVLVFAWSGSGRDKLDYIVAESDPEQVSFSLARGMTRDLRFHTRVYALRANVRWSIKQPDHKNR